MYIRCHAIIVSLAPLVALKDIWLECAISSRREPPCDHPDVGHVIVFSALLRPLNPSRFVSGVHFEPR